jgi:hypothetical protein
MTLGVYADIVNAQNVTFTKGAEGEVITLYDIRLIDESIIDRRNARAGPIDTPTFSLIEIVAKASISKDLYTSFRLMRQLTTRGALPTDTFGIVATSPSGAAADFTDSGTFILRRMEDIAQEQGRYEVELTMRIQGLMTLT